MVDREGNKKGVCGNFCTPLNNGSARQDLTRKRSLAQGAQGDFANYHQSFVQDRGNCLRRESKKSFKIGKDISLSCLSMNNNFEITSIVISTYENIFLHLDCHVPVFSLCLSQTRSSFPAEAIGNVAAKSFAWYESYWFPLWRISEWNATLVLPIANDLVVLVDAPSQVPGVR